MLRLMRLLMMVAVLWCGVHAAVPDHAIADMGSEACAEATPDTKQSRDAGGNHVPAEHSNHHHCPVAPGQPTESSGAEFRLADGPLFARPVAALLSHSQAPPLQPPSA